MKVKYERGPAAQLVPGHGRVERGKSVDVSKELAEQLLEQGWVKPGARKKTSSTGRKKTSSTTAATSEGEASAAVTTPESTTTEGD